MNSLGERDDEVYLRTARTLAISMTEVIELDRFSAKSARFPPWPERTILDFGCGTARLLAGLEQLDRLPKGYIGLDVQQRLVDWAGPTLGPFGDYRFDRIEMHNRRYNPDGATTSGSIIPSGIDDVDLIVARSVFTHMTSGDIAVSLREFRRVLGPNGRAYVTVNVRNGVPAWTDNPGQPDAPPLLRVELNKSYFELLLEDLGFAVSVFVESVENQCAYLLRIA